MLFWVQVQVTWGIYTLLVAFIINLVLVALRRFTHPFRIFTGNAMIVQAGISTFVVWKFFGLGMIPTVFIAS